GTSFLGDRTGWSCGYDAPYLDWSGDDTSAGGAETVVVDLDGSFDNGEWSGSTTVTLAAGWYSPAEGYGPATLTVALRHQDTGEMIDTVVQSISPGRQSSCATTLVGTVNVLTEGLGDDATVWFELV
ncbi:MAG: hypothetical protein ACOC95_09250, partial [Planctomycetota bacterium]